MVKVVVYYNLYAYLERIKEKKNVKLLNILIYEKKLPQCFFEGV